MRALSVGSECKEINMSYGKIFRLTMAIWLLAGSAASAQPWRGRTTTLVVPLSVGTGIDSLGRFLSDRLAERIGAPVVVENRPGASALVGTENVANSAPDGYTLLLTPGTILSDAAIHRRPDPTARFAPVILLTIGPNGMVVGPRTTAKSVKDVEALAKAKPGQLFYSAAGTGSVHTLAMELFKFTTGADITRVPFKGSNDALNYVVTGQVEMMTLPVAASAPFVQAEQLRMLAVLSNKRTSLFPDVPTMAEAGYPAVTYESYYFLLAPKDTPANIVSRLNTELNAILADPAFKPSLDKLGLSAAGGTPEDLAGLLKTELARLRDLVDHTKMTGE
jgi:tripartite-type tricarboxylate transporter receptor subunit TctC